LSFEFFAGYVKIFEYGNELIPVEKVLALLVDIKTSPKKLARTKRSADFAQTLVMKKKKSFMMTLTPEIHIISREKSPS
jgi:hypothetical protein